MEQLEHRYHTPGQEPPRHPINDANLMGRIFPRGYDPGKEHYARSIASRYGYGKLCDLDNGTIEEVSVDIIWPCQSVLSKTHVIELALYLNDNDVPGYPMGIRINGEVYLIDGHHRVTAQILRGKKTVMMHLTDLAEDDPALQTRHERHYQRP